jgi:hypothetical protein
MNSVFRVVTTVNLHLSTPVFDNPLKVRSLNFSPRTAFIIFRKKE